MFSQKGIMRRICLLLVVLMALSMLVSCAPADKKDDMVVKIAVAAPMTGDHAEYGISYFESAKLMAAKWNENGGAGGYTIEIVQFDDKSSGEEAATIAERLVEDMSVVGVIGSYTSGTIMAATPTYQDNGLCVISPSASHPDYSKHGNYIFRNNTVISVEGATSIECAEDNLNSKKIGILYIKTDWGAATNQIMQELIAKTSMELVRVEECIDGSDDYSTPIANFENAGCDTILVVGMHNTFVPFARQYRGVNPDIQFVAFANLYNQQVIDLGGEAVEGTYFPVAYFNESDDPKVIEYRDGFIEAVGKSPSSLAAQAYDAAGIYCEAIAAVGNDRAAIRDYIANISYEGVGGMIQFDEVGDAQKTFMKIVIRDGKFVLVD
jgi:branched-chain amino acid transport system substrate-binding protein